MSIVGLFKSIVGGDSPSLELEGTIAERPAEVRGEGSAPSTLVFHLDSKPDLEFRLAVTALAVERHRGDRVRVHYQAGGNGTAKVEWIETI